MHNDIQNCSPGSHLFAHEISNHFVKKALNLSAFSHVNNIHRIKSANLSQGLFFNTRVKKVSTEGGRFKQMLQHDIC